MLDVICRRGREEFGVGFWCCALFFVYINCARVLQEGGKVRQVHLVGTYHVENTTNVLAPCNWSHIQNPATAR